MRSGWNGEELCIKSCVTGDFGQALSNGLDDQLQVQHATITTTGLPDMRLGAFEQTLPNERLAQE